MNAKIKNILKKKNKSKILCLTAYSKNFAELIDKYVDITLIGDSLGSVLYNYDTTKKVTLTNMIDHSKSVRLGVKKSLMVVDMPFNTYRSNLSAYKNAKLVIKETKCDAVKLEGGKKVAQIIKTLVKNKIPVRGYISCVSHCPYENYVDPKKVGDIAHELIQMGCYEVSLGDTTGKGSSDQTSKVISECLKFLTPDKLAGHFHDTFQNALNNIKISLEYGIKTFDSSVGGLGGCPYSPGAKGNVSTEKVNNLLLSMGYKTNLNIAKIKECNKIALNLKEHGSYE